MPDNAPVAAQPSVRELKVSSHLMSMEPGLYCVFQTPGTTVNDGSGLPAARLSLPPDGSTEHTPLEFAGFRDDGWVGEFNDALLVRVRRPCSMLVTIYHGAGADARAPNLQVVRLAQPVAPPAPAKAVVAPAAPQSVEEAEVAAHIQGRGDVAGTLSAWIGEPGSGRWIEGFSINPAAIVSADDIEYQAVLGRGWLSPWMQGGEFCGSRGMALPILGLRVRLRGDAEESARLAVEASFTDGTRIGPVDAGQACEAPNLAPLEAFRVVVTRTGGPDISVPAATNTTVAAAAATPVKSKPKAAAPAKKPAKPAPKAAAAAKPVARPAAKPVGRPKGRRG